MEKNGEKGAVGRDILCVDMGAWCFKCWVGVMGCGEEMYDVSWMVVGLRGLRLSGLGWDEVSH